MSRTYKTDPWMIRAYRNSGRPIDKDWRTKWDYLNSPPYGTCEWDLWWNECPTHTYYRYPWDARDSGRKDRAINHRRIRARERECIAHEDYDAIPKITKQWYDWQW